MKKIIFLELSFILYLLIHSSCSVNVPTKNLGEKAQDCQEWLSFERDTMAVYQLGSPQVIISPCNADVENCQEHLVHDIKLALEAPHKEGNRYAWYKNGSRIGNNQHILTLEREDWNEADHFQMHKFTCEISSSTSKKTVCAKILYVPFGDCTTYEISMDLSAAQKESIRKILSDYDIGNFLQPGESSYFKNTPEEIAECGSTQIGSISVECFYLQGLKTLDDVPKKEEEKTLKELLKKREITSKPRDKRHEGYLKLFKTFAVYNVEIKCNVGSAIFPTTIKPKTDPDEN